MNGDTFWEEQHRTDYLGREAKPASVEPLDEVSELAKHGDPSRTKRAAAQLSEAGKPRRTVTWVRPTELIATATERLAGLGIDFQAELGRRARTLPVKAAATTRQGIRERAGRLAPLSAFGSSGAHGPSVGRHAIGRQ